MADYELEQLYKELKDQGYSDFSTPEEALAWQEKFYSEHPNGYSINVYKCDGKTIIGTFTFQRGREVK